MTANLASSTPKEAQKTRRFSLVSSIVISLSIFICLLALLEIAARSPFTQGLFNIRSVGNYHAQFEIKWFKLKEFVQANDGVDVILLGNSMTNTGLDPQILAKEYEELTGLHLRIFNFGVEGLTVAPNSALAQLLVDTYHPKSIVYFTEMRDYVAKNGVKEENAFLSDSWFQYRLGKFSLESWLVDHSAALQIILPFRGWTRFDFLDTYLHNKHRINLTHADGYEPEARLRQDIDVRPDPTSPTDKPFFELFRNFQIDPLRLENLNTILSQADSETRVLVTEIPVYATFYDYFGGVEVHQIYLQEISKFVNRSGVVFVPPINSNLIPLDGRADRLHLNDQGAQVYSKLLAIELAKLCLEQQSCLVPPTP